MMFRYATRPRRCLFKSWRTRGMLRDVSIWCNGKSASQDELFKYTNGRFLVNEHRATAKRYVEFDVDNLCKLVSGLPAISSSVIRIDKMEGGFNKALLMTAASGKEAIAKIRCPNAGLSHYTTASEVATMEFVRTHTSIPIPSVFAWSSDPSNPIGAEYIIMEKAPGKPLLQSWGAMTEPQRYKLIQNLARLESELVSVAFPAYGSVYFQHSKVEHSQTLELALDTKGLFCLGPMYNDTWPGDSLEQLEDIHSYSGPWKSLSELGIGLAKRGIWHLHHTKSFEAQGPHHGSLREHERLLKVAMQVIPFLAQTPALQSYAKPVLLHTDLHLGNMFVAEEDPTRIVSIIDWQFLGVLPLFTQARWPVFLTPPEGYQTGNIKPRLPLNYGSMDEDEKAYFQAKRAQAMLSKCYEGASLRYQKDAITALTDVDENIRDLFTRCENTYKEGIIPLRECLITIANNWDNLGLPGTPPITFSPNEESRHEIQKAEFQDWLKLREYTQEILCSDSEGWVPPQFDFDEVQAKHDILFRLYLEREVPSIPEEEARRRWFYRNVD